MKHIWKCIALAACITFSGQAQSEPHSGPYAGVLIGGSIGQSDATNSALGASVDVSGIELTGVVGIQGKFGGLIGGVEADLTWRNVSGSQTALGIATLQSEQDWSGSIRLRLGLPVNNFLIYATGGVAFVSTQTSLAALGAKLSSSDLETGWIAGAGVEYQMTDHVRVRAEALHTVMDAGLNLTALGGPTISLDNTSTAFRVGALVNLW